MEILGDLSLFANGCVMKPSMDDSYRCLAARYLREQAKRLAGELVGVRRGESVECVHQARIATRRLRAALGLFKNGLPKKAVRRWRKSLRRVARGLGTARDCDVHAGELAKMLVRVKKSPNKKQTRGRRGACRAIAWLLVDLEQRREACQPRVLQAIDGVEADGVLEEILHMAKETLVDAPAGDKDGGAQAAYSAEVFRQVGGKILDKYERLRSLAGCLKSSRDKGGHHQMRIAAKRLRYTMEIAGPIYGGRLDNSISAAKKLQSLLGDIHDCDVWGEHLAAFGRARLAKSKKFYGTERPGSELKAGFARLARRNRGVRAKRFAELVDLWKSLRQKGQWDELLVTIRSEKSEAGAKKNGNPSRSVSRSGVSPLSAETQLLQSGEQCRNKRGETPHLPLCGEMPRLPVRNGR